MAEQASKKTILLVEDDAIVAMTEKLILEKNGFTVLTAATGETAVETAQVRSEIDLVLMDIDLGKGIDGTVAAQQILSSRELPVVFLSSHTEPEIVEKTGKITSYGYVVKNSGDTVLMTSIRMAFKLFDAKQEAARHEKLLSETMQNLEASLEELKKSQRVANVGNWIWHIPDNRLEWSDQMYIIFGIEKEHFTGKLEKVIDQSIHPEDRAIVDASNNSVITAKAPIPVEYRIIRPDGGIRTVWAEAGELELDEAGNPRLLRGIVHDITDRKAREEKINALLLEKELILKESHHRIKNHYFVVESLLREQAADSDSPEAAKILKDAASRISGMHLLYEKLLQSDDFNQISLGSYLHELAAGVMKAYSSGQIHCETAIEDLPLDIDMIFPLGAIAVELMTNSLKYAFPPKAPGEILLSFAKDQESYRLIVSDNGRGLPEEYTSAAPQHFGLMLVALMAKQLGGSFSMDSVPGKGTESRVIIPVGKSPFPRLRDRRGRGSGSGPGGLPEGRTVPP